MDTHRQFWGVCTHGQPVQGASNIMTVIWTCFASSSPSAVLNASLFPCALSLHTLVFSLTWWISLAPSNQHTPVNCIFLQALTSRTHTLRRETMWCTIPITLSIDVLWSGGGRSTSTGLIQKKTIMLFPNFAFFVQYL